MNDAMTGPDWRPDEVALFRNRYRAWARNWALAGALAIAVGVPLAMGEHVVYGILLAAVGGTFGLIFGFAFWLTARTAQSQLDRLRAGGVLARWVIDADRWWAWHDARQSKLRLVVGIVVGAVALVGFLLAAIIYYDDGDVYVGTRVAIGTLIAMPLSGLIMWAHKAPTPSRSMRQIPLLIGPRGALTVGIYLQWYGFGLGFLGARVIAEPPTLQVDYRVRSQHGAVDHTLDLPVPPDRLDEAEDVAAALNAGVG